MSAFTSELDPAVTPQTENDPPRRSGFQGMKFVINAPAHSIGESLQKTLAGIYYR